MTVHIDFAVTEVIPEEQASSEGERVDPRWTEQDKIKATLAQQSRLQRRVAAEGFDD